MQQLRNNRKAGKVLLLLLTILFWSCSDDGDEDTTTTFGDWAKTTPFKGRPRSGAIVFTIGTRTFVGLGYDGDEYINDFYAFDANSGYWETKKNFPGTLREMAVSFSVNGKGYVGLGYNRELDKEELRDFWEYDPATDDWVRTADFPGTARYHAVGFAIGSKAFVGTGYDGDRYNSDFWQFDVQNNVWKEIVSYPGEKIEGGLGFVVNGKGYVCGGRNNGLYNTDFWEFDPENVTWTKRSPDSNDSDYDEFKKAVSRHDAVAVTVNNKAFIVGGLVSVTPDKTVYEFNALNYTWDDRKSFEGSARSLAIGFVLNDRIFVGTGQNGSNRYDDIWEFNPNIKSDD